MIINPNDLGLGRVPSLDPRDNNFLMASKLPAEAPSIDYKFWHGGGWFGNQGNTSECVLYAWTHFLEGGPIMHPEAGSVIDPHALYKPTQELDEWEGTNYDGTSVRAGAKMMQQLGWIDAYYWAYDLDTLALAVLTKSPAVVGTEWFEAMFFPNRNGILTLDGPSAGGHAYLINGVNMKTRMFRMKNSWGIEWGMNGHAWISFDNMAKLINRGGEICLATEIPKV